MHLVSVQTHNVVYDDCPEEGFRLLKETGFDKVDFSLNMYLKNTEVYSGKLNDFFDKSVQEMISYFAPYKAAAFSQGIHFGQMHMPYPIYLYNKDGKQNEYMMKVVAPKSMEICAYLECPYIVIHGFKLRNYLGGEEKEWQATESFLDTLAPFAAAHDIVMCVENLYDSADGKLIEGPCTNARIMAERIDRFNSRYGKEVLGFCFDVGHANIVGLDMEGFISTLGHRLKALHIHDNDGIADLHQIPFTFTKTRANHSSTDWEGFIRGIRKSGYSGTLSFETAPVLSCFPLELKREALGFISSIGRYFSSQLEIKE